MIGIIIAAIVGAGLGAGGFFGYQRSRRINGKNQIERDLADAKIKAGDIVLKAKDEALKIENERRREWQKTENRLADREKTLDNKLEELDRRSEKLRTHEDEIDSLKSEIRDIRSRQQEKLEKIAGLKKKDAADKLMKMTERDIKQDLIGLVAKLQHDAMDDAEERAQMILVTAMERMSSEVTAERTVTAVKLTDDEMKGRIIGKEGRNIQSLQRETGVDILVDDTPGMVILSSFDPIRRQVARLSLEMLMKDGRIHPARIEEMVEKAQGCSVPCKSDVVFVGEFGTQSRISESQVVQIVECGHTKRFFIQGTNIEMVRSERSAGERQRRSQLFAVGRPVSAFHFFGDERVKQSPVYGQCPSVEMRAQSRQRSVAHGRWIFVDVIVQRIDCPILCQRESEMVRGIELGRSRGIIFVLRIQINLLSVFIFNIRIFVFVPGVGIFKLCLHRPLVGEMIFVRRLCEKVFVPQPFAVIIIIKDYSSGQTAFGVEVICFDVQIGGVAKRMGNIRLTVPCDDIGIISLLTRP